MEYLNTKYSYKNRQIYIHMYIKKKKKIRKTFEHSNI